MTYLSISDLSIVLIEPSVTQLKIILNYLHEEGVVNIQGVSSGEQAMALLENYQPDLIISSMYLPDMTATELFSSIKSSPQFENTVCMLISSETNLAALEPIRQSGVVAILPKPFSHSDLKRALRATIELVEPEEIHLDSYDIESIRVLVVDDSIMSLKHITRILNNMGISHVSTARNGKEALQIFSDNNESFDLIVTDYNMPEMDGEALIKSIRDTLDNRFVPILMVTSEANEKRLSRVLQAGVSAICDKPFEPMNIREMLFRLLEQH
ncbi:response regulator [Methylicorpusculum oleiharenae]|uniref:response regulator n=1 Tax=Methylicorpusculum oleiharenae TaxID=1338687 RepID=UPI0013573A85|nr:response regulator [Methylicorpusculum oleiharenae]MCD2452166.1 response regulator [Methylicorpusculum oleiharenae]